MRTLDKSRKSSNQANPDSDSLSSKSSNQANPDSNTFTRTPKLRFKGFDGEWLLETLEPHIDVISGIPLKSEVISEDENGIPILRGINITEGVIRHSKDIDRYYLNSTDGIERYFVAEGDLVIGMDGSKVGKNVAIVTERDSGSILIQRVARIRNKPTSDIRFVFQHIFSPKFHRYVDEVNTSSGIPHISLKQICEFRIFFPSLPEQQKIAAFLSAVDEKIQQLTRKKEALERYKKGVMQQLFSGKLRFKDENGKAFPKWEEKRYEEIFTFYTTNSFSRENLNYDGGKVKNIHYGDIHTKFSSGFDIRNELVPFINDNVDLHKLKDENYCQEGDLVIADASEDYSDIGKTIELINLDGQKVVAGLHTFLARPAKGIMYKGFSGYSVQAPYVRKQVKTIAQGSKVLSLSPSRLGKIHLKIPSHAEQQKIACYLSGIDTKLERVSSQINETRMFKKGLLQQMFA
jgi:type I restriction enzyme S subunit